METRRSKGQKAALWILFAAAILAVPAVAWVRSSPEPPVLFELPEFHLVDQAGRPFDRQAMLGEVWIVDFIYTRCAGSCPMLTQRMREAKARLDATPEGRRVRLLSITVDPTTDTPERLADYARKWAGDDGRWIFATGEKAAVEAAVIQGFKTAMGPVPQGAEVPQGFDILHGKRLVLVDPKARIRGYYEATPEGLDALVAAARRLADSGGA